MADMTTVVWVLSAAVGYALAMWKKAPAGEEWQWPKFLQALLIGIAIGAVAWQMGVSYEMGEGIFYKWPGAMIVVGSIDQLVSWLRKKVGARGVPPPPPAPTAGGGNSG